MTAHTTAFEVRVRVKTGESIYNSKHGMHIRDEVIKMVHIFRRTPKQAAQVAQKYGEVLSVQKADTSMMFGDIEQLKLGAVEPGVNSPYTSPVAMDSLIFDKRNKRRKNMHRDKDPS